MALPKNFYKIYKERLAAEEQITYLPKGKQSAVPPHQQPRYQVLEVKLQGKNDQPLIITGNEVTIPQQLSMLKAIDMLADNRGWGGGLVDFYEWWEQWKKGLIFAINRKGTLGMKTNYPYRKVGEVPAWREDKSQRPAYLEWNNPNPEAQLGNYRIIEYWPNRSKSTESYVLIGTDSEIIQQILNIEWSPAGVSGSGESITEPPEPDIRIKHPYVYLFFNKKTQSKAEIYASAQCSYRLMNLVEHSSVAYHGEAVISINDIKQIQARIEAQFFPNLETPYKFKKGKLTYYYREKERGYRFRFNVNTETTARELLTKVLATNNATPDLKEFRQSRYADESVIGREPPTWTVAGQQYKRPRLVSTETVEFRYAAVVLPMVGDRYVVCSNGSNNKVDERLS